MNQFYDFLLNPNTLDRESPEESLESIRCPPTAEDVLQLVDMMRPVPCPMGLIRIGGTEDGAYLVPNDLEGIQACFSPGVNNFKRFEDELTLRYRIPCHMCDYSSSPEKFTTPLIPNLQTFEKSGLPQNQT